MIRTAVMAGFCIVMASPLHGQYRPGIGRLERTDVYLDGTDMGDSSRSLTTVGHPLRYLETGPEARIVIAFAMGMDRHDTTYSLVLSGSGSDSLFSWPTAIVGILINGHTDTLTGRHALGSLPRAAGAPLDDRVWCRVTLRLLRDMAGARTVTFSIPGQERRGAWELDDASLALLRRLLAEASSAGVPARLQHHPHHLGQSPRVAQAGERTLGVVPVRQSLPVLGGPLAVCAQGSHDESGVRAAVRAELAKYGATINTTREAPDSAAVWRMFVHCNVQSGRSICALTQGKAATAIGITMVTPDSAEARIQEFHMQDRVCGGGGTMLKTPRIQSEMGFHGLTFIYSADRWVSVGRHAITTC